MSDSESFPSQPQRGSSNHSQISTDQRSQQPYWMIGPNGQDMDWLLALAKSKHPEQRKHAQRVICRLSEAEYRLAELRREKAGR